MSAVPTPGGGSGCVFPLVVVAVVFVLPLAVVVSQLVMAVWP